MGASAHKTRRDFTTVNELFLETVETHPKPDAFLVKSHGRYQGVSSQEALRQVAGLASGLSQLGLQRGDRVALLSENRLEWALTDYAVLGLGAVLVPIYPTLLEPDLEYILRDSGAKGLVLSTGPQLRKVSNIRCNVPELRFVLMMDREPAPGTQPWHEIAQHAMGHAEDCIARFRERAQEVRPEDTASILYTSGTTGQPKGVLLTHANIVSNVRACRAIFPLAENDLAVSFLPLSHIFERMGDYYYFCQGVAIAYAESFESLTQNLLEVRPTVMTVVPRVLEKIRDKVMEVVRQAPAARQKLFRWAVRIGEAYFPYQLEGRTAPIGLRVRHVAADALVFSKVRARLGGRLKMLISGSAPLSRAISAFFYTIGLPVYEGYGLTETSPVITVNCPGRVKLGTVGRVLPGVEITLGEEMMDEQGGVGREILVRGPNVTPGYYHLDEENHQAFRDSWFRTGDLGLLDADGFLTITGRKKDLFKTSGGKYVSPERIENLFQGHLYISQIMVIGNGRRFVSALVVPNFARLEAHAINLGIAFKGRQELVSDARVKAFLKQQVDEATRWLAPHEKIRKIAVLSREFTIDSGELSPTQKTKRRIVEGHYQRIIEEIYHRPAPLGSQA